MRFFYISLFICCLSLSGYSQNEIQVDYLNEANKFLVMSDYKNAEDTFMRGIEFYRIKNDSERIVDCRFGIATIKYLKGNYPEAVLLFENLKNSKSIFLNEFQREAVKSAISVCKEFIKTSQSKN